MALKVSAPLGAVCVPRPHPRASVRRVSSMRHAPDAPAPHRRTCAAAVADAVTLESTYKWQGSDQFSELDDRRDAEPLPLPLVTAPLRVVLVRHGQSTWNASGRIQGSSDFAVLTPKGEAQADTTRQMVRTPLHAALSAALAVAGCCGAGDACIHQRGIAPACQQHIERI